MYMHYIMNIQNTSSLKKLAEFLQKNHPNNVMMPGVFRTTDIGDRVKAPMFAHKDGKWTWTRFKASANVNVDMWGILIKDLIVIDIDGGQDFINYYEDHFKFLTNCPKETTRKGAHYFFKRTALCDRLKIVDKARELQSDTLLSDPDRPGEIPIDIKTICSTGVGGFLIVTPSENKSWVTGAMVDYASPR